MKAKVMTRCAEERGLGADRFRTGARALVVILFVTLGGELRADTELLFGQLQDDEKTIAAQRIRIKSGRLSIDGGTDQPYMIFYGDYNRAYVIDHEQRQYLSLDPDKVSKIVASAAASRQQALTEMEAQLKTVPAAQRPQLREMVAKLREATLEMENAPERQMEFKPTGESVKLGGHQAEVVEAFVADKKTSTYYLVSRKDLNIPDEDYAVIQKFAEFLKTVEQRLPPSLRSHFGNLDMLAAPDGKLPLKVEAIDGRPEVLLDLSTEPIAAKEMNVPAAYAPQDLPDATVQ